MRSQPPRVFISYSHDSVEHRARVLALADRLRSDGVDARLDQYEPAPAEGWQRWVGRQIEEADFVLVVCTLRYEQLVDGSEDSGRGLGVGGFRESLFRVLDGSSTRNVKLIPVVFAKEDSAHIPSGLRSAAWCDLSTPGGYEALYRVLTEQPEVLPGSVGKIRRAGNVVVENLRGANNEIVGIRVDAQRALIAPLKSIPWGGELLKRLHYDGMAVRDCRRAPAELGEADRWLLQVRVQSDLRNLYGLAPEILILVVPEEAHGRDLLRARQELYRTSLDLDPDLLVVVDDTTDLMQRLAFIAPASGQWIPWCRAEGGFPALADQLKTSLPAHDIFEHKDPVRGRQVIGRTKTTADITRRLRQGGAVGVFGLRKVGKTSVVRAATDHLDPVSAHLYLSPAALKDQVRGQTEILVAWLDCQLVHERSLGGLAQRLGRELQRRLELEGFKPPSRVGEQSALAWLSAVIEEVLSRSSLSLCIVLDEYDLLFESTPGDTAVENVEKLFGLFRGFAQQTGRLALVVIGRDPVFLNRPKMGAWPNPMLQWLTPYWLGPLEMADADELLVRLGRRVCLDIGERSQLLAYQWTGGHPLLHRQFGSAFLELARNHRDGASHVQTDPFCNAAIDVFLGRDAVSTICHEVSDLLIERYSAAADRLHELSLGSSHEDSRLIEQHGGWHHADLRVLRNFGLLLGSSEEPWIPEVFRWFARTIESYDRRIRA